MGVLDLELSKKARGGSGKWERVPLPKGMAEPNISDSRGVGGMSTSPAPGRPGQGDHRGEKRGRESTGSPTEPPKAARTNNTEENSDSFNEVTEVPRSVIEESNKRIVEAKLVSEATISPGKEGEGLMKKPDLGSFVSVVGTPVKQNPIDMSASPILSSRRGS